MTTTTHSPYRSATVNGTTIRISGGTRDDLTPWWEVAIERDGRRCLVPSVDCPTHEAARDAANAAWRAARTSTDIYEIIRSAAMQPDPTMPFCSVCDATDHVSPCPLEGRESPPVR